MAKDKNLTKSIGIIIIIAVTIFAIYSYSGIVPESAKSNIGTSIKSLASGGGGSTPSVVNEGASMKAYIVDENGNIKDDLNPTSMPESFAIISYKNPKGFSSISPATCTSGCDFLAIGTAVDNSQGDSNIAVNSVLATTICNSLNTNPSCSNVPNIFGDANAPDTKRGNLNSKYLNVVPLNIAPGLISTEIVSDPISLDEAAFGLMDLRLDVGGTFKDPYGNDMPLAGKYGAITLRIVPSVCSDNTPVDPTAGDADVSLYCSTANKGKYCRVGAEGIPTLTDKASFCGCPSGQFPTGDVCKINSCIPGCIAGTVTYCLDGVNFETRCNECGKAKCPKDANGASAISCNPESPGSISQCVYPGGTGNGLLVSVSNVNIPTVPTCGDGIKSGTEQCDTSDFGGLGCSSVGTYSGGTLTCNSDCTYNTGNCVAGYVKFRTQFSIVSSQENADGIAFNTGYSGACNKGPMKRAGENSAGNGFADGVTSCDNVPGLSSYTKMFNINKGLTNIIKGTDVSSSGFALYKSGTDYALAGFVTGKNKCIWVGFKESQPSAVDTSAYSVDTSKEMNC